MANRDYVIPQGGIDGEVQFFRPLAVTQDKSIQILTVEVMNATKTIEITGVSGRRNIETNEAQAIIDALQSAIDYIEEM